MCHQSNNFYANDSHRYGTENGTLRRTVPKLFLNMSQLFGIKMTVLIVINTSNGFMPVAGRQVYVDDNISYTYLLLGGNGPPAEPNEYLGSFYTTFAWDFFFQ